MTVGLTPTSTGCSSSLATTSCVLILPLPPGSYVGTLTTLDASGVALSTAQSVAINVVAGTANTIAVTLSGIPAGIGTSVASTGGVKTAVLVYAVDNDGDIIIGPGAPTFTITPSGPVIVTQPSSTSPNMFVFAPTSAGSASFNIVANYPSESTTVCAQSGTVCAASKTATITDNSRLFVAQAGGVFAIAPPFTGSLANLNLSNISGADSLALDSKADLFVEDSNSKAITEYAPPYSASSQLATITSSWSVASDTIAIDVHDNLFVADNENQYVFEYAPPYTGDSLIMQGSVGAPGQMTFDPAGDLIVPNTDFNYPNPGMLYVLAPPYNQPYPTPTTLSGTLQADVAALDSSGELVICDAFTGVLVYASVNGATPTTISSSTFMTAAFDANGDLFLADSRANTITEIAPPITSATPKLIITSGVNAPYGVIYKAAFNVSVTN